MLSGPAGRAASATALPGGGRASRWHVLIAGFLCYGFDAVDFMMLALPETRVASVLPDAPAYPP